MAAEQRRQSVRMVGSRVERRQLRGRRRHGRGRRDPRPGRHRRACRRSSCPVRHRRRLLVQRHRAGELVIGPSPSRNGRARSATMIRLDAATRLNQPSLHERSIMILGRIWNSIAAQFNKLANAIRGYDPIAEMQYEYDRSVEQIKEGREGLAQYRALVERVTPPGGRQPQARLAARGQDQGLLERRRPRHRLEICPRAETGQGRFGRERKATGPPRAGLSK